jgi:hypothetical protein
MFCDGLRSDRTDCRRSTGVLNGIAMYYGSLSVMAIIDGRLSFQRRTVAIWKLGDACDGCIGA